MEKSLQPLEEFGFIITRYVNSEITNEYWINCIRCIRKHYPSNKIVIIDDASNYNYIKNPDETLLSNCIFIQSEYPRRGELLGYYYFYKNKFFQKAMIIHDSAFIHQYIDVAGITDCKFLFHATHNHDDNNTIIYLLNKLNHSTSLIEEYWKKEKWEMCFGVQSVITLNFLEKLQEKYNFFNLLNHVLSREMRMALERVFGLLVFGLLSSENCSLKQDPSIFGDTSIYEKENYGYPLTYQNYVIDMEKIKLEENSEVKKKYENAKYVKVSTGR